MTGAEKPDSDINGKCNLIQGVSYWYDDPENIIWTNYISVGTLITCQLSREYGYLNTKTDFIFVLEHHLEIKWGVNPTCLQSFPKLQ